MNETVNKTGGQQSSSARRILITGVSRGLGKAALEQFVERGHKVAGCARSRVEIEALEKRFGDACCLSVLDLTDARAVDAWAERLEQRFGMPDLLVNCAAVIHRPAPLWELSADEFGAVIDNNLKGPTNVLRAFVPRMIKLLSSAVIVNLSSTWGRTTAGQFAPYCATKWGIEGLTGAVAEELPAGFAAASLNPGVIDTDMLRQAFGGQAAAYPKADDWAARAVPLLLSLDAEHNGARLDVPLGA